MKEEKRRQEVTAVLDLQFGSTGKGLASGAYARLNKPDTIITAWMPNAGHTYVDSGFKMIHTALANGVISPKLKRVLIAPATVLSVDALMDELHKTRERYKNEYEICVHENASILQPRHSEMERQKITGIGSTQKGSGAAVIEKVMRNPQNMLTAGQVYGRGFISQLLDGSVKVRVVSHQDYLQYIEDAEHILIEGAQGYSLGIHSGFYPYTTSRECTIAQLCSDCLISPFRVTKIIGVARMHPIRVANRTSNQKWVTGWSGNHYDDQEEISFESIGQPTEYTTVTKLPRRVFSFSDTQFVDAIRANGAKQTSVFLNFANYVVSREEYEKNGHPEVDRIVKLAASVGSRVSFLGWGPEYNDIMHSHGIKK